MVTITTTTTSNPVIARERSNRGYPGLQFVKKPVGAGPTRRTIARGAGSYNKPDSTTGPQTTVIPAKAGIQLSPGERSPRFARDDEFQITSSEARHCEAARQPWQSHCTKSPHGLQRPACSTKKPLRPLRLIASSASRNLSLRRSASTVAISDYEILFRLAFTPTCLMI
jgi:hypothetical protein